MTRGTSSEVQQQRHESPALIPIQYVAASTFSYRYECRGVCAFELDDASGGDQSFDVKCGGLHQVVTEVVPVSGGEDEQT